MPDRTPPHEEEAEEQVLSAFMTYHTKVAPLLDTYALVAEWFFMPAHQIIWFAIEKLRAEGSPVNKITVTDELNITNQLLLIGGREALTRLQDSLKAVAQTGFYLTLLRRKHQLRQVIGVSKDLERQAFEPKPVLDDIVASGREALSRITPKTSKTEEHVINVITGKYRQAKVSGCTGIPSRWDRVTDKSAGYQPGKLTVVGARPKIGKSMWMTNETNFEVDRGIGAGIITLEMTREEIIERHIADELQLDLNTFRKGEATDQQLEAFEKCGERQLLRPIFINESARNILQISSWIRDMVGSIKIAWIDYFQLIKACSSDPRNERERYAHHSHIFAELSKETGIAINLLAQLGRNAEFDKNDNRILPQPKHLKGSGEMEQDAYQVYLLARAKRLEGDEQYDDCQPTTVKLAYNRGGPSGIWNYLFVKSQNRMVPEDEYVPF